VEWPKNISEESFAFLLSQKLFSKQILFFEEFFSKEKRKNFYSSSDLENILKAEISTNPLFRNRLFFFLSLVQSYFDQEFEQE